MFVDLLTANRRPGLRYKYRSSKVREEPNADRWVQVRSTAVRIGTIVSSAHNIRV